VVDVIAARRVAQELRLLVPIDACSGSGNDLLLESAGHDIVEQVLRITENYPLAHASVIERGL
jgi:hypothetical protein